MLAVRNVLVSDIGLIVKAEPNGPYRVYCTDLRTAQPLAGVSIELQSFQRKTLASATSDASGTATFSPPGEPAFVVASYGSQHGYLRVDNHTALVTSHFDTGGEVVKAGVKGFLYGERGVWRPGDTIHLTFVLWDPLKTVPAAAPRQPRAARPARPDRHAASRARRRWTGSTTSPRPRTPTLRRAHGRPGSRWATAPSRRP